MISDDREKRAGVCERCGAVCAVWLRPDGEIVPISPTTGCDCAERTLSVVDAIGSPTEEL